MGRKTVNRMYRMVVARPLFVLYITAMTSVLFVPLNVLNEVVEKLLYIKAVHQAWYHTKCV